MIKTLPLIKNEHYKNIEEIKEKAKADIKSVNEKIVEIDSKIKKIKEIKDVYFKIDCKELKNTFKDVETSIFEFIIK